MAVPYSTQLKHDANDLVLKTIFEKAGLYSQEEAEKIIFAN
jgi:hypothetical protein